MKPACFDLDDFCDATLPKIDFVLKLKDRMPALKVTLFTIPAKTSDATIAHARALGDWVTLGMHGWAHTLGECWTWDTDIARRKMQLAADRGIDGRIFRAPKWIIDRDTYDAAASLGWVIADHINDRIIGTEARTYTYNEPIRNPPFARMHGHLPNVSGNGIEEHFDDFVLPRDTQFVTPFEIATIKGVRAAAPIATPEPL